MRVCRVCGVEKNLSEFYKDSRVSDGCKSYCKECEKARQRNKRAENPDAIREYQLAYYYKNRDRLCSYSAALSRAKGYAKTPLGRIRRSVTKRIYDSIKGERISGIFDVLGYGVNELKAHLESRFTDGMSWDNYGIHGWHIDHIKPLSLFDIESNESPDLKAAWALENLQPLWAKDNLSKGAKYEAQNDNAETKNSAGQSQIGGPRQEGSAAVQGQKRAIAECATRRPA